MGGAKEPSVANTMCELCGTMLRVSTASNAAAQAGLAQAWEDHLSGRHGAELAALDGSIRFEARS